MNRTQRAWLWIHRLLIPGVVLHEIAHALVIAFLPNLRITELDLTSHVKYEGYSQTVTRSFLIAYAPLFVNTSIALASAYALTVINPFASVQMIAVSVLLLYAALATAFTAFPSVEDATAPLKLMRHQLLSRRIPLILLLGPFFILLSLPGLVISYICEKSLYVQFGLGAGYTVIVLLLGFGVINIEPATFEPVATELITSVENLLTQVQ